MASIGPQIPEHLLKGKNGTVEIVSDDEDEFGPAPPPDENASIGPQAPPRLISQKPSIDTGIEEDEEDDSYGPALPPDFGAAQAGPSSPKPILTAPPKRILGPSFPAPGEFYDDDDDDFGPKPLPSVSNSQNGDGLSEGVREFIEKEERRRKELEEASKPKQLKREEWMLVPPTASGLLSNLTDPTKLKARQFSKGGSSASRSAPNNLWTETPAERQQRIADEVAGKKKRAVNAEEDVSNTEDARKRRRHEEDVRRAVNEYNKSKRGDSLLDMHSSKEKDKKEDDEEGKSVIWEHDRDMSMGGRLMDEKQRNKLITDARGLGSRFSSGKTGGFL